MLNLLKTIAVQDQTVTSNIATLDNIMSGVDGSATFGYTLEAQSVQVNDNQKQQYAHTHTLDIRVLQGTAGEIGILNAIVNGNLQAKITGISPDGFLIWDDPSYMVRSSQFDQVVADQILVTKTQPAGYAGTAPNSKLAVYSGDNALALYNVLSGSASVLNGFSLVTSATGSVTGSVQTITAPATVTTNTVYLRSANIFFPFAGESITASITADNNTGGSFKLGIEFVQSDGSTIISTSYSGNLASVLRDSFSATAPANTAFIRMVVVAGTGVSAGNTIDVSFPMLALAGRTTFTI
jgi:hypothetical protein